MGVWDTKFTSVLLNYNYGQHDLLLSKSLLCVLSSFSVNSGKKSLYYQNNYFVSKYIYIIVNYIGFSGYYLYYI
jgi:hypothetical protein